MKALTSDLIVFGGNPADIVFGGNPADLIGSL